MKKRILATLALCLATGTQTFAASEKGAYLVRGIGSEDCASLRQKLEGSEQKLIRIRLSDWVSGWLSHSNRVSTGIYDVSPIFDGNAVSEIVVRVCGGNLDAKVETVLNSVVAAVSAGAPKNFSKSVVLQNGDLQVVVRENVLSSVQNRLSDLGFLEKKMADGKFGPATKSALLEFQTKLKLPITGLPDALTTYAIFLEK